MLICVSISTLNPNGHCSGRPSFCHLRGQRSLVQRMTELSSKCGGHGWQIPPFPPARLAFLHAARLPCVLGLPGALGLAVNQAPALV